MEASKRRTLFNFNPPPGGWSVASRRPTGRPHGLQSWSPVLVDGRLGRIKRCMGQIDSQQQQCKSQKKDQREGYFVLSLKLQPRTSPPHPTSGGPKCRSRRSEECSFHGAGSTCTSCGEKISILESQNCNSQILRLLILVEPNSPGNPNQPILHATTRSRAYFAGPGPMDSDC